MSGGVDELCPLVHCHSCHRNAFATYLWSIDQLMHKEQCLHFSALIGVVSYVTVTNMLHATQMICVKFQ